MEEQWRSWGDALRQAFIGKQEYESLREEEKAWIRLQRRISVCMVIFIALGIVISSSISLKMVYPFCRDLSIQPPFT